MPCSAIVACMSRVSTRKTRARAATDDDLVWRSALLGRGRVRLPFCALVLRLRLRWRLRRRGGGRRRRGRVVVPDLLLDRAHAHVAALKVEPVHGRDLGHVVRPFRWVWHPEPALSSHVTGCALFVLASIVGAVAVRDAYKALCLGRCLMGTQMSSKKPTVTDARSLASPDELAPGTHA